MTFAKVVAKYALPVALVATFAANANAAGLIPGQCYAKADAQSILTKENQLPIIIGNRITDANNANVFFLNNKGYGYNIEGDAPNGVPSTKLCVRAAYKNANIRSLDMDTPPEWAKNIKSTGNGIDVAQAYKNGSRIVLGAQTYTPKADGTEVLGKYIVVSATPSDKAASVWSVDNAGSTNGSFSMTDFVVTNFMNQFLSQTVGQSSLSPTLAAK